MLLLSFSQEDQRLNVSTQLIAVLVYFSLFAIPVIGECMNLVFQFIDLQNFFSFFHLLHRILHFIKAFLSLHMVFAKDNS
jgi:hypothetical protein